MQEFKLKWVPIFCVVIFISFQVNAQKESRISIGPDTAMEGIYIDDVVQRDMMTDRPVLPYEHVREADIPWERRVWRVIDVREKLNLPFVYPGAPFFDILKGEVLEGNIAAFRDEGFEDMLTSGEVEAMMYSVDTVDVVDPVTYEITRQITRSEVNPEDIRKYRLKEIWYFDKERSVMDVRLLGVAPVREYYDDETGVFKYEAPMFWIYFPEARKALAGYPIFNEKNDVSMLSWTDLFEMRKFSSYIYKVSNIHDMRLVDIYPNDGVERLYESERIKSELFNWEHDLWTY